MLDCGPSLAYLASRRLPELSRDLRKVHYLQWTGVAFIDRVVGIAGIVLVLALTVLGAWLAFKRN